MLFFTNLDLKSQYENMKRRDFIKRTAVISAVGLTGGFSLVSLLGKNKKHYFRPPGALEENQFLAACIRCGKCIQDCPYDTLKLGSLEDGINIGTPYIDFRDVPCQMCADVPCIAACPTTALNHDLKDVNKSNMGTAVITDREACLSLNGIRCEICYRVCPLTNKAITLDKHEQSITKRHTVFEPVIHKEFCTGCGICENACPLDKTAITVLPTERGDKAAHYILLREQT